MLLPIDELLLFEVYVLQNTIMIECMYTFVDLNKMPVVPEKAQADTSDFVTLNCEVSFN